MGQYTRLPFQIVWTDLDPTTAAAPLLVEIESTEFRINNVAIRHDGRTGAVVLSPAYRHPRKPTWTPAIELPPEVWKALSVKIGEAVVGHPVRPLDSVNAG